MAFKDASFSSSTQDISNGKLSFEVMADEDLPNDGNHVDKMDVCDKEVSPELENEGHSYEEMRLLDDPTTSSDTIGTESNHVKNESYAEESQCEGPLTTSDNVSITDSIPETRIPDNSSDLHSSIASTSAHLSNSIQSQLTVSSSDSSYLVIDDNAQIVDASSFEESGLFYGSDLRKNKSMVHEDKAPSPPPESAFDVLLSENVANEQELVQETRPQLRVPTRCIEDSDTSSDDHRSIEDTLTDTRSATNKSAVIIDPGFVLELERRVAMLTEGLDNTINGLTANLEAMSVCAQKSVALQRDTISNLQQTVDDSAKAMYTFVSKFNEIHRDLQPIQELAVEISEINENLKILERLF